MVKCLEEILVNIIAKRSTKSARNKGAFLAYWPQIKELQAKKWKLTHIYQAMQEAGVGFGYSALCKYVRQQSELEAAAAEGLTPKELMGEVAPNRRPRRAKKQKEPPAQNVDTPVAPALTDDYDQPPRFGPIPPHLQGEAKW